MQTRRQVLQQGVAVGGLVAGAGLLPQAAMAFDAKPFEIEGIEDTLKALGVEGEPEESSDVTLKGPDIAENGAVVPFTVATSMDGVKKLALLIENNPNALSALFDVTPAVEADFSVRSKMQETSDVYALAITDDGKAFYSKKEVKVTLGGCGG